MTKSNLNLQTLETAVSDYLCAEEDLQRFLKTWTRGRWPDRTAQEREDYTKFSERESGAINTVSTLCRLINVDFDSLVAVIKSISRYARHGGTWDRCTALDRLNRRQEDHFFNLISTDTEHLHYQSTGRRKPESQKAA